MSDNMNLYNKVKSVPQKAQKPITGGRLKGMTDITPMWRIETLTELFGPCGIGWYIDFLGKTVHPCGEETVVEVDINLYIKIDGEWSKPIFGTGGSKLVSIEKKGAYVNDEAIKMATTDAISVACKHLGFGADIYYGLDNTKYNDKKKDDMNETISSMEAKTIRQYAERLHVSEKRILSDYKIKSLEAMTKGQYASCLQRLIITEEEQKNG